MRLLPGHVILLPTTLVCLQKFFSMNDSEFLISLGARIREIRLEKKITQHQLARLCSFEKASMSRIESGKTNVTVITLQKICKALEVDMAELFVANAYATTREALITS